MDKMLKMLEGVLSPATFEKTRNDTIRIEKVFIFKGTMSNEEIE